MTLYKITSKISTDTLIPNHAHPPLPQIPNLPNPNVHNYVLSAKQLYSEIGRDTDLARRGTRLTH